MDKYCLIILNTVFRVNVKPLYKILKVQWRKKARMVYITCIAVFPL
jgi:hypothetical protein